MNYEQIADLERFLKTFEQKYQMLSESFYQRFQAGELGDSIDFFEWSIYYEMRNTATLSGIGLLS
ncbi:hypothetical protein ACE1B6_03745 [Aerosakkonemataceae cyanobacterium BLCC-F154]|uniref:Uncharacterized protein n=1 Tax=Floridaenema fluviatile BLCC-F154 TaxID=3153640 RepID=A0ABV4Y6D9_9CYAN